MESYMERVKYLADKATLVLKEDPLRFVSRGVRYTYYHTFPNRRPKHIHYKDILFIDGTGVDYLVRYRMAHLMEQLAANGMTSDAIHISRLSLDLVRRYRGFVFYRNTPNGTVKQFIKLAKYYNKTCIFSIDDLVIDREYTDTLEAVKLLPTEKRKEYSKGVEGYGNMMRLCSYSITTTEPLAREMKRKGSGEVFVCRNTMSQEMISLSDKAIEGVEKDPNRIIIGYFSGSETHNIDFQMILPALQQVLRKHENVYIKLVGRITPPEGLEEFADRLIFTPFLNWRHLPEAIRQCDINLAPLADGGIFNESKSENKWSESALVKVVTLASNVGAFKTEVKDGVTGVLANNDEWVEKLELLVADKGYRDEIARNAYDEVRANRTTLDAGGRELTKFLQSKLAENVKFIIPSINISGGINVIFKHANILREQGSDVTLISLDKSADRRRLTMLNEEYDVIVERDASFNQVVDKMVATHWSTFEFMKEYPNVLKRYYLVQGYESLIYAPDKIDRILANATYADRTGVQYITISPWCVAWLRDNFGQEARYAPNGIKISNFPLTKRTYDSRIKILIEGNHKDPLKNVDEAFKITNSLDKGKFSVSYLSYDSKPKKEYEVDEVYNKIHPDEVGKIYAKHHILLKTSLLESFSFPPLEMMATGGQVVAMKNAGNAEYLSDSNAIIITPGDIAGGIAAIERLADNKGLRDELCEHGLETVKKYDWTGLVDQIAALYN